MIIKPIQQHIDDEYNGSKSQFAKCIGKTHKQVCRYIEGGYWWVCGAIVHIKHGEINLDSSEQDKKDKLKAGLRKKAARSIAKSAKEILAIAGDLNK